VRTVITPVLLACALLCSAAPSTARASVQVDVRSAEWVSGHGAPADAPGALRFISDAGQPLGVVVDPSAAAITNPAWDGTFHPFTAELVAAALAEVAELPGPDLAVTIYCLPGLPQLQGASFTAGHEIFLAAAVGEISPRVAAYTVVHELGHVVQHVRLPAPGEAGWDRYLALRGLTDGTRYNERAIHRDRPAEVFAEDFRALFGGPLATYSGTIENPDLPAPAGVAGLRAFMADVLLGRFQAAPRIQWVANFPNPFNPSTTIRAQLRDDLVTTSTSVQIEVLDLRGRLVMRLPPMPAAPQIAARWDGTDARGQPVASGRYLFRVWAGGECRVGSMLLLK
jgi:hypothetical protein